MTRHGSAAAWPWVGWLGSRKGEGALFNSIERCDGLERVLQEDATLLAAPL